MSTSSRALPPVVLLSLLSLAGACSPADIRDGTDAVDDSDTTDDTDDSSDTDTDTGGDETETGDDGRTAFGGSWQDDDDPSVCTVVLDPGADAEEVVNAASPGDVICLRAGEFARLIIENSGQEGAPITVRAYPGERQLAKVVADSGYSIRLNEADHVEIEGLWLDGAIHQGLYVYHSDYVIGRFNKVTNVGQECMRFKFSDFGAFAYNTVQTCGTNGPNGEGIYVGSGDEEGDDTHGVTIVGNDVSDTHDEGIELKGSTYDILVEGNRVHDLTCRDGGGIVVTSSDYGAGGTWDTGHVVRGNIVWNVQTSTSYKDGNGINARRGAHVYNNVVYGNQHFGIRVDDKWGQGGLVEVHHNTMCDNGISGVAVFNDTDVDLRGNIGADEADNIACDPAAFADPSGGDYRLLPSAAAALDGAPDLDIDIDIDGAPRPAGAGFDFGAYEHQP